MSIITENLPLSGEIKITGLVPSGNKVAVRRQKTGEGSWVELQDYPLLQNLSFTPAVSTIFGTTATTSVAYGNGVYVAVGFEGKIATSQDGISWTQVANSTFGGTNINKIAFGSGIFIAGGNNGKIATSANGTSWTQISTVFTSTDTVMDIKYRNNTFVVAGGSSLPPFSNILIYSTNGITWSASDLSFAIASGVDTIEYGKEVWVITIGGHPYYSADLLSWNYPGAFTSVAGGKLSFGNDVFVLIGQYGLVQMSADGINWETTLETDRLLFDIDYGDGLFFLGTNATLLLPPKLYSSTDGINWNEFATGFTVSQSIEYVEYVNGIWFIFSSTAMESTFVPLVLYDTYAQNNTSYTYEINVLLGTSTVVFAQTQQTSGFGTDAIRGIAYGNNLWVAVGDNGKLATSANGIDWVQRTSSFGTSIISSIAYGNNLWVAVDYDGKLATSANGIDWVQRTSSFGTSAVLAVAYGNNLWVAVGSSGKLATSINGIDWVQQTSSFGTTTIRGIAYGNNLWVAVGYNGKLATSANGIDWVQRTSSFGTTPVLAVAYGNNLWVAVGDDGKLATSANGIDWVQQTSGFGTSIISSISYGNNLWVAVGSSGKLATFTADIIDKLTYTSTINSQFCDSFICDSRNTYKITNELTYDSFQRVQKGGIFEPFGNNPVIINNGIISYESGIFSFAVNATGSSNFNRATEMAMRKELAGFLSNKRPKILKDINGNIWLVVIPDAIPQAFLKAVGNGVADFSFYWIQIGGENSQADLERLGMLGNFRTTE